MWMDGQAKPLLGRLVQLIDNAIILSASCLAAETALASRAAIFHSVLNVSKGPRDELSDDITGKHEPTKLSENRGDDMLTFQLIGAAFAILFFAPLMAGDGLRRSRS
jgi:hypothetical protein